MTHPPPYLPRAPFLVGIALSLLPALGPLAAGLLMALRPWPLQRRDLLWAAAAATLATAAALSSGPAAALSAAGGVAGPWLVFRAFAQLRRQEAADGQRRDLAVGLLVGFAALVILGLLRSIEAVDVGGSRTLAHAIVWQSSPALFGHAVLALGGAIALATRRHRAVSWAALALAAGGIVVSGSPEAALGWLVLLGSQLALRPPGERRRPRAGDLVTGAALLLTLAAIVPFSGGRLGFLLQPAAPAAGTNLLSGTELPRGGWWDDRWVEVETRPVELGGATLTGYEVRKRGAASWLRLQQLVALTPGAAYTLSGWIDTDVAGAPGFQGWADAGEAPLTLAATLREGTWNASLRGPGELLGTRELARDGSWRRLAVSFRYAADAPPATLFVGFAPDARTGGREAGRVAGLMLEAGERAGRYQAGGATVAVSFGYARAPLWRTAWDGVRERPLAGWGEGAFAQRYAATSDGLERAQVVPAHPHNLPLWILFERGVIGLIGLTLLLIALFGLAVRYRDLGLLAVVAAVLLANLFDATLLSGAVLYPLAAVAGWRSALRGPRRAAVAEPLRRLAVPAALVATDLLAAFLALALAREVAAWAGAAFEPTGAMLAALALWPALAWREGLIPGYGLTEAQELRRQVTVWAAASALFVAAATVALGPSALPWTGVAAFLVLALIAGPIGRAGAKRLLHAMRLWGRPVVILGAGATGRRVARALRRTPMDGLQPLALFDDRPELRGTRWSDVRVRGTLDEAAAFARRHRVDHAIVAIPGIPPDRLERLTSGRHPVFRRVQFVPRLGALPVDGVSPSGLDGMLALEVRNGLASPWNRAVKRASDVVLASFGLVLLAPLLAGLYAWVRLDSSGGGFHRSERVGRGGRRFACLKFRTMHEDAEALLGELLTADPGLREQYDRWHKLNDDPRVTRAGRFLRRTSLDELPQLWNVLRGEMSLVGPRPYLARELPDMGEARDLVLQARPGVTGYWQVSGRNEIPFEDRVAMEAHYVRNWSIWWDVVLLVRTPVAVIGWEGAGR